MQESTTPRWRTGLIALVVGVGLVGAGYFIWQKFYVPVTAPAASSVLAPAPLPVPPVPTAPPPVATARSIQYPVDAMSIANTDAAPGLPLLDSSDKPIAHLLTTLLGKKAFLTFLQGDAFIRNVVATVDNLGREHAPVSVWPVNPTPQRFTTLRNADGPTVIDPRNGLRYAPLVQMVEAIDTAQVVALYRQWYPLFQQAYEELGFPGQYFNDRLVVVIDQLLATPVPTALLAVKLVEVKGPVPSIRPWVRNEFADPALEALSAGQKIMLRVGPVNQRRLAAKLRELRQGVVQSVTPAAVAPP
jgi:hypothetical protein